MEKVTFPTSFSCEVFALKERTQMDSEEAIKAHRKMLVQHENRLAELDRLFMRLYEDSVAGKISDERYVTMSAAHENNIMKGILI